MQLAGNRGHFQCEHCGRFHFPEQSDEGVALIDAEAEWDCPICTLQLRNALVEGEPIVYCVQCRGFLTEIATFGRIVTKRRAQNNSPINCHKPFDACELRRSVSCPRCRRRMETHPYGGGGNAVVDTCPRCCLIWLDARELSIIGRYVPHVPRHDPPTPLVRAEDQRVDLLDLF
jgi:Zn-finger nucleic acid-binding protein